MPPNPASGRVRLISFQHTWDVYRAEITSGSWGTVSHLSCSDDSGSRVQIGPRWTRGITFCSRR
jgi:hypothetical protein